MNLVELKDKTRKVKRTKKSSVNIQINNYNFNFNDQIKGGIKQKEEIH